MRTKGSGAEDGSCGELMILSSLAEEVSLRDYFLDSLVDDASWRLFLEVSGGASLVLELWRTTLHVEVIS